jgi:hypothetical protein
MVKKKVYCEDCEHSEISERCPDISLCKIPEKIANPITRNRLVAFDWCDNKNKKYDCKDFEQKSKQTGFMKVLFGE